METELGTREEESVKFVKVASDLGIWLETFYRPYLLDAVPPVSESDPTKLPMRWEVLLRVGRDKIHETNYSIGSGHCVYPNRIKIEGESVRLNYYRAVLVDSAEGFKSGTGGFSRSSIANFLTHNPQPKPNHADILMCLVEDARIVEDYATIGEMANELGYLDVDEAIRVWDACKALHSFLISALGVQGLADLMTAADRFREVW